jgi:hypothetical protein
MDLALCRFGLCDVEKWRDIKEQHANRPLHTHQKAFAC